MRSHVCFDVSVGQIAGNTYLWVTSSFTFTMLQASARVFEVFKRSASACEKGGLDEAHLDMTTQVGTLSPTRFSASQLAC